MSHTWRNCICIRTWFCIWGDRKICRPWRFYQDAADASLVVAVDMTRFASTLIFIEICNAAQFSHTLTALPSTAGKWRKGTKMDSIEADWDCCPDWLISHENCWWNVVYGNEKVRATAIPPRIDKPQWKTWHSFFFRRRKGREMWLTLIALREHRGAAVERSGTTIKCQIGETINSPR